MKIFRKIKIKEVCFSWDYTPDLAGFIPDNKNDNLYIKIETTRLFQTQVNKLSATDLKRVKDLRKEIREGEIIGDGKLSNENTHILTGGGNGKNNNSLLISKDINKNDRLVYRVYKLEHSTTTELNSSGEEIIKEVIFQKVVLESCIGHQANGQGDYYNNPATRAQFNRKRRKDNNSGRNKKK